MLWVNMELEPSTELSMDDITAALIALRPETSQLSNHSIFIATFPHKIKCQQQ